MNAMTSVRILALAAALTTASAVAANAQAGWPSSQPQQSAWPSSSAQPQGQTAWPSNGPPAQTQPQPQPQPQQQAAWPSNGAPAAPAAPPQQAPWPASAPPGPMAAPPMGGGFGGGGGGGFGGGGMGGPSPAQQQECVIPFTALRAEVEKKGMAAKAGGEKQAPREEMCKLVTAYSAAEIKWVKFAEANASKCGIPKEIVKQLQAVHAKTADGQKKLCAAGPAGGPVAAPTLSEALGVATLPTREPEKKRKSGGTLDTLTGPALAQ
jgi:hypothetical protein